MVRTYSASNGLTVILSPNLSMAWKGNLYVIAAVAVWMGVLSCGFWLMGAWPVVPFVGLELVCLVLALWHTQRKLCCREVILISDSQVVYEQGLWFPLTRMQWRREGLRAQILRIGHPLQSPQIDLYDSSGRHCRIGAFLNKDDSDLLIQFLRGQGILLRTDTEMLRLPF